MRLSDFTILRPEHETEQAKTLDWIFAAHVKAEEMKQKTWDPSAKEAFCKKLQDTLNHVACKPDRVQKRGHILADYLHQDWKNMQVYALEENPAGLDLGKRLKVFSQSADAVFEKFYEEETSAPHDLIHVTCTGYVAPSGAQKLVAIKGWGDQTTVTHAYHMGCYGAISAIRMAKGFLSARYSARTDIVHTEICSLHINPSLHSSDQLVAQSLFADGFIKYSMRSEKEKPSLKVLNIHEKVIPNSTQAMTWNLSEWGFQIALAKEVPVLIARALNDYLSHLCNNAGLDPSKIIPSAHFAIHPGGPKILHQIQQLLSLKDAQLEKSFQILKSYGNMSSATLPHIWKSILEDDTIGSGEWIVSLAFGPGLCICGALMQKD